MVTSRLLPLFSSTFSLFAYTILFSRTVAHSDLWKIERSTILVLELSRVRWRNLDNFFEDSGAFDLLKDRKVHGISFQEFWSVLRGTTTSGMCNYRISFLPIFRLLRRVGDRVDISARLHVEKGANYSNSAYIRKRINRKSTRRVLVEQIMLTTDLVKNNFQPRVYQASNNLILSKPETQYQR